MPGAEILELIGITPILLAALVGFWKADDAISTEFRSDISEYLKERVFKKGPPIEPGIVLSIFHRYFGSNALSASFIYRSSTTSILLLLSISAVFAFFLDVDFIGFIILSFLVGVVPNLLADYLSLVETKFILKKLANRKISKIKAVLCDIALTLSIFTLVALGWLPISDNIHGTLNLPVIDDVVPNNSRLLPSLDLGPYLNNSLLFSILYIFAPSLITTFFTSIWLWIAIFGSKLIQALPFLGYALPIDERPIRSIGVSFSLLATGALLSKLAIDTAT